MQGSPHAGNRWQANLHNQIISIGFVQNNIDHLFYSKNDNNHNLEAMLSSTVDDLLLSCKQESTQQLFYTNLSAAFNITTPTDVCKFFNFIA